MAASTPLLVGTITSVVAGSLAGLIVADLGGSTALYVATGIVTGLVSLIATFAHHLLAVLALQRDHRPRFPGPTSEEA